MKDSCLGAEWEKSISEEFEAPEETWSLVVVSSVKCSKRISKGENEKMTKFSNLKDFITSVMAVFLEWIWRKVNHNGVCCMIEKWEIGNEYFFNLVGTEERLLKSYAYRRPPPQHTIYKVCLYVCGTRLYLQNLVIFFVLPSFYSSPSFCSGGAWCCQSWT